MKPGNIYRGFFCFYVSASFFGKTASRICLGEAEASISFEYGKGNAKERPMLERSEGEEFDFESRIVSSGEVPGMGRK